MVAVPHFFLFSGVKSLPLEFISAYAVEIFFVLSGFVLAQQLKYCFSTRNWDDLWTFLVRRWMRTLPPYILILCLISALTGKLLTQEFFGYTVFSRNLLSVPESNDYFAVAWSLSVEEWFYIVFPLFGLLFLRSGRKLETYATGFVATLFLAKVVLLIMSADLALQLRRIVVFRLDAIAFGFLLHGHAASIRERLGQMRMVLAVAGCTIGAYFAFAAHMPIAFAYLASAAAALTLVAFISLEGHIQKSAILKSVAGFAANTSYSLYLSHTLVFLVLSSVVPDRLLYVGFVIYVVALLVFCALLFIAFERPILTARPTYTPHDGTANQASISRNAVLLVASNAAVFLLTIAAVEAVAWGAMWHYRASRNFAANFMGVTKIEKSDKAAIIDPEFRVYSSPQVFADMQAHGAMQGTPYRYESYITYAYRPFRSRFVNIEADGQRSNGVDASQATGAEIWVFGSSPIFGMTSADDETVPAYIEKALNENGASVKVSNFGVVGYTAWQDFLNLSLRLAKGGKPDVVVVVNGHNDYNLAWLSDAPECARLVDTAVGSGPVLRHAWETRAAGALADFAGIEDKARSFFVNTSAILDLANKALDKARTLQSLSQWKTEYSARAASKRKSFETCGRLQQEAYLRIMSLIADLGAREGFLVVFAHQPTIFSTGKELIGVEAAEMKQQDEAFFAMSDEELAIATSIPGYRLNQPHVWDKRQYLAAYLQQKELLAKLANSRGAPFVDLDRAILAAPQQVVFSSTIHYTFRGARLIGQQIADEIGRTGRLKCLQKNEGSRLHGCLSAPK